MPIIKDRWSSKRANMEDEMAVQAKAKVNNTNKIDTDRMETQAQLVQDVKRLVQLVDRLTERVETLETESDQDEVETVVEETKSSKKAAKKAAKVDGRKARVWTAEQRQEIADRLRAGRLAKEAAAKKATKKGAKSTK